MDLSQGDLWGSLVTRDLGNTGLGWLLLDRLVVGAQRVSATAGIATLSVKVHSENYGRCHTLKNTVDRNKNISNIIVPLCLVNSAPTFPW